MAESFNAKIKLFRANLRGVADKKFFLFRIAKLYAYPIKILLSRFLPIFLLHLPSLY
ncbi:transposase [Bacteroides sp. CAG:462]|nr:transposase [Bacteroides sp. CAG:462]